MGSEKNDERVGKEVKILARHKKNSHRGFARQEVVANKPVLLRYHLAGRRSCTPSEGTTVSPLSEVLWPLSRA